MCKRFVTTPMPPEEEQLNEVLQLRSQGMTYKQIAEKTGHPQSTVAHWCQTNTPKSPQKVEVLMVNDFEAGMTVITLPVHKFEFFRKSDLIYFKVYSDEGWCELYEIRGTIIHKTLFPTRGELYPYFIDMIHENGELFLNAFSDSLQIQRPGQMDRLSKGVIQRLNQAAYRYKDAGWVWAEFLDWTTRYLKQTAALAKQIQSQFHLIRGASQATPESARDAYQRWEDHQRKLPEFEFLQELAENPDDGFDALFPVFLKERHGIPKKHAKIVLKIKSIDAKKIKHFVDSGANSLQEFEQLHASGLATFAEYERVNWFIPSVNIRTLQLILPHWSDRGLSDQHGVRLENYKEILNHLDVIAEWPSIKEMQEAIEVGFDVEEYKQYEQWISKLSNTNWELTHAHINQFRQLDWDLDDLLRFDSPEDMALHAIIDTSPDTVSHAKLLENYKATHGTNLGNARNLHDRLQSPPFDTMVESDLDAGIIQKLAGTKAKRKSAPKPKKTAKKDATPDVSKALVDLTKYPKLSASKSDDSERVKRAITHGDLEDAIAKAVVRLERICKQHCDDHGLEYQTEGKGWLHDLIEQATSHAIKLTTNRNKLMHQAITTRGKIVHSEPARANISQLKAALQVAEDMP